MDSLARDPLLGRDNNPTSHRREAYGASRHVPTRRASRSEKIETRSSFYMSG